MSYRKRISMLPIYARNLQYKESHHILAYRKSGHKFENRLADLNSLVLHKGRQTGDAHLRIEELSLLIFKYMDIGYTLPPLALPF